MKKAHIGYLPMRALMLIEILWTQSLSPPMVCFILKNHFDAQFCEGYSLSLQDGQFSKQPG